jgi:hypothetical protein
MSDSDLTGFLLGAEIPYPDFATSIDCSFERQVPLLALVLIDFCLYLFYATKVIHHSGNERLWNCPFFFAKLPEWLNEEEGTFRQQLYPFLFPIGL